MQCNLASSIQERYDAVEGYAVRATRMVLGLAKLSYEERLKKLDIPSLSYRRFRGDMIEVHKYLHGLYFIDCSDILPIHINEGAVTRGHRMAIRDGQTLQEIKTIKEEKDLGVYTTVDLKSIRQCAAAAAKASTERGHNIATTQKHSEFC